eukprot:2613003-Pyramimonas_sp.AAC.1
MYLQSRWFRLAGFTVGPFWAARGIIAGCGFATALIRVCASGSLGHLDLPRQVHFKLCIGDSGLSATGPTGYVIARPPPAARTLRGVLSEEVGAIESGDPGKRSLIASS